LQPPTLSKQMKIGYLVKEGGEGVRFIRTVTHLTFAMSLSRPYVP